MARTTPELVAGIVEVEDGFDLTPMIDTASMMVTDNCLNSGYDAAKLEMIERWLAAHCYKLFDNMIQAARVGPLDVQYTLKLDKGLASTYWGQQAMLLDTAGNLAKLDNSMDKVRNVTVGVTSLGYRHRGRCGWRS